MRTKFYFVAALAATMLASCADDKFVGDNSPNVVQNESTESAINFGGGFKAITRADHFGADAADKLKNKFYVVAFNGDGSSMSQTFDNYLVEWAAETAGTTESNTSDWEYVDKTAPAWSSIHGNKQTIKYWDYSKAQYDFIAWSPGTATPVIEDPTDDIEVKITAPTAGSYDPTYTLEGTRVALAKCYIADMVTAYKADQATPQPKFQDEVKFSFRNLACKVRMAIYETVPGYSVKGVRFYTAEQTGSSAQPISSGAPEGNAHLFTTGTNDEDNFFTKGTYTVSFPTKGSSSISNSDYNKAHVDFVATNKATKEDFGSLVLKGKDPSGNEDPTAQYLGRSLPDASYANPGGGTPYYKTMLPNEDGTVLELRVDYTLLATDGSGEEIKVYGAKAFVPAIYAAWKPNYAYTYIFKISDNTNGWTSQVTGDPQGLYPITFDAVVVDAQEHTQSTITTVATPSITTYQKGHDVNKNEYLAGSNNIYIQVMSDGALKDDLNGSGKSALYTLSSGTWTEADVMDALNIKTSSSPITGRNGLTLSTASFSYPTTIPGADGNDINLGSAGKAVSFAAATGTYAYVYFVEDKTDSYIYSAKALDSAPDEWPSDWYTDPDGLNAASSDFTPGTYYKKYTNDNKVYGVKIIKVVAS